MFSEIIDIESIEATRIFDVLYQEYFYPDFIANRTHINGTVYIDPQRKRKDEGKELAFWHLTTREKVYTKKEGKHFVTHKERLVDYNRAERLCWVRPIIENFTDERIKVFYKKETKGKRPIRLYLWAYDEDFVVILQKLGRSSSFLVTSFYITHAAKRRDYQRFYENYIEKKDEELIGCEWF